MKALGRQGQTKFVTTSIQSAAELILFLTMDEDTHTYTKKPKQPPQTSYICLPWRSLAAGIPEQSMKLFDLGDQCSESHKGHCATVPEILELHRAKGFIYETCFVSPLLKE